MPVITLPDGSQRHFDASVSVHDVAADIGAGLAKAALAGVVDGREVDTSYVIKGDVSLSIVTDRDDAAIEIIRHSTAHLLAQAVQQLFPGTQVTIGPTVEDGFYYDFASGHNFTLEDLDKIEARMVELAAAGDGLYRRGFAGDTFNTAWYLRRELGDGQGPGLVTRDRAQGWW